MSNGNRPANLTALPLATWNPCPLLRGGVVRVLRSREAAAVNFRIPGLTVNRDFFTQVADMVAAYEDHDGIRLFRVTVEYEPDLVSRRFGGTYRALSDTMTFPFDNPSGRRDEAVIVHEAVHLGIDLRAVRMRAVAEEALAYLAQALYLLNSPPPPMMIGGLNAGALLGDDLSSHPILRAARPLAERVRARPDTPLTGADLQPISDAAAAHREYSHLTAFGGTDNVVDGVRNIGRRRTPVTPVQGF